MHVNMYICIHACVCVRLSVRPYVRPFVGTTYVCMEVGRYVGVSICMCRCECEKLSWVYGCLCIEIINVPCNSFTAVNYPKADRVTP